MTRGCSSPAWPTTAPSRTSSAHRPGCHGAYCAGRTTRSARAAPATTRAACTASAQLGRAPVTPPARTLDVAGEDDGRVPWLWWNARVQRGHLLVGRPMLDARLRNRRGVLARQVHQAHLEQREVARAPPDVALEGGQQAGQQRCAQLRLGLGDRVDQPGGLTPRVVGSQAERVVHRGRDERVTEHLGVAGCAQRPRHGSPQPLLVGQPVPGRRSGQLGGDLVVALEADDLLDQVGRIGEIRAPGRRNHAGACRCPRPRSRPGRAGRPPSPRRSACRPPPRDAMPPW